MNIAKGTKNILISINVPAGKQIKTFTVAGIDKKSQIVDDKYTISELNENTTITLELEDKPATSASSFTFTLLNPGLPEEGYEVTEFKGTETEVIIPSTYDGKPVKYINPAALKDKQFTDLVIPNSIELIPEGALSGCNKLVKLTIPFIGESRTTPEGDTNAIFVHIFGKTNFTDSYLAFEETATKFYLPNTLKELTITDTTRIPAAAFAGEIDEMTGVPKYYTKLKKITLPNNLLEIGGAAFANCGKLKIIVLSDDLLIIDVNTFASCSSLETIKLPKNLTKIEEGTFFNCTSLTNIIIAVSVTYVGENAFGGCSCNIFIEATAIDVWHSNWNFGFTGNHYIGLDVTWEYDADGVTPVVL